MGTRSTTAPGGGLSVRLASWLAPPIPNEQLREHMKKEKPKSSLNVELAKEIKVTGTARRSGNPEGSPRGRPW